MKQFKAEWQEEERVGNPTWKITPATTTTIDHLITQHNALVDYLADLEKEESEYYKKLPDLSKTITLPKPDDWLDIPVSYQRYYKQALSDASKALGVEITLKD